MDVDDLGLKYQSIDDENLHWLLFDIDKVLQGRGMKRVFIFDQINRIFARHQFTAAKDVGTLPYPFKIMTNVRKACRIISIISASTNNDITHREKSFGHPIQFEKPELEVLYTEEKVASWSMPKLEYATGRIPLHINKQIYEGDFYPGLIRSDIMYSLQKLQHEQNAIWKCFIASSVQCLLRTSLSNMSINHDRKYLKVQEN